MTPLDLSLATAGYLVSEDGRVRHVIGLDRLAADTTAAGARIVWCSLPGHQAGWCLPRERLIYLAPWVYWARPPFIRRLIAHELAHVVTGRCCEERARRWSERMYGDLVLPLLA